MRSAIVAGFAAVALFLGPSIAQAAQGFIVDQTELKAGPDDQFPTVVAVQAGVEVDVFGCLSGNSWCDVSFQQERGWVAGQDLEVIFQSKRVKIVEVTTVIVPVVTFEVKTYWAKYYSSKPFFKDRDRFASINININNGGKAAPGATGSGGQASITGSINKKPAAGEKTGAGAAAGGATGEASATENKGCPAGQKNCKPEGNVGGGNAMGKTATGGAMTGGKADKSGQGQGPAVSPTANAKGCKPGTANCPQKGNGG